MLDKALIYGLRDFTFLLTKILSIRTTSTKKTSSLQTKNCTHETAKAFCAFLCLHECKFQRMVEISRWY